MVTARSRQTQRGGAFLTIILLTLIASSLLATPRDTGIRGQACLYISYGTPVEIEPGVWVGVGDVMMPVTTSFAVLSAHSRREMGRFSTDASGAFTVSLPPGKYVIVPDPLVFSFGAPLPTGSFEVTVSAKRLSYALILYYQDGPGSIFEASAP